MLKFLAWKSRDNARTPMQWDDSENAGFTTGTPWIMTNPNYKWINAKEQVSREDSVFHYYRRLIRLCHEHEIVVYGSLNTTRDFYHSYLHSQISVFQISICCSVTWVKYIMLSNNFLYRSPLFLRNSRAICLSNFLCYFMTHVHYVLSQTPASIIIRLWFPDSLFCNQDRGILSEAEMHGRIILHKGSLPEGAAGKDDHICQKYMITAITDMETAGIYQSGVLQPKVIFCYRKRR